MRAVDDFIAAAVASIEDLAADHGLTIAERVTAMAALTWRVQQLRDEARNGLAVKEALTKGART